jgi:hypothetical protein
MIGSVEEIVSIELSNYLKPQDEVEWQEWICYEN